MTEIDATGHPVDAPRHAFRKLPEPIRLEDTVTTHDASAAPDPQGGRDTERDFMLRYGV